MELVENKMKDQEEIFLGKKEYNINGQIVEVKRYSTSRISISDLIVNLIKIESSSI